MEKKNARGYLLVLCLLLGLIVIHLLLVKKYFFLCDDSFISFRYLSNWLDGEGLVFNPGERVEGYTNFLWIVLLALPASLGISPESAAPVLGILASLALLIVVFFSRRIAIDEKPMSWSWLVAPLFLVVMRTYGVWATSGLETRLFSLLVFCGALSAFRAVERPGTWYAILASLVFALAELLRPEGLLFFGTAVALVFAGRFLFKKPLLTGSDLAGLGLFVLIVGGHFLGRYVYYESWLPNTFYAKVGGARFGLGLSYLSVFGLEYAFYFWLLPLIFFIYSSFRARDIFSGFWLLFPLPYLLYVIYIGGDHFEYRFLDPVLPIIAVLVSHGLIRWVNSREVFHGKRFYIAAVFCLVFLAYQQSLPRAGGMAFGREYKTAVVPEIDPSLTAFRFLPGFNHLARWFSAGYKPLVEQFAAVRWEEHEAFRRLQEDRGRLFRVFMEKGYIKHADLFCMPFIGALPYYSGIRVIDFHGLADPVIARGHTRKKGPLFHARYPSADYMEKRGVDFIIKADSIIPANRHPEIPWIDSSGEPPELSKWTDREYIARFDGLYIIFFSTRSPEELSGRFRIHGIPIYIYVPVRDSLCRPVSLEQWLEGR